MEVFSFENSIPVNIKAEGEISISKKHYKDGQSSLCWHAKNGKKLSITTKINYKPFDVTAKSKAHCSFLFWVYQEKSIKSDLRIEFGSKDIVNCYFDMHMDFTGWRTVWVPYDQMQGTPSENMDKIIFSLSQEHTIYLDQIIPMQPVDSRHNMRDFQVPFVNLRADTAANSHWMSLYRFAQLYKNNIKTAENVSLTQQDTEQMDIIVTRFEEVLQADFEYPKKDKISLWWDDIGQAQNFYKMLDIKNNNGTITGKTIAFSKQDVIYPSEHKKKLTYITAAIDVNLCSDLLLNLAQMWCCAQQAQKKTIEDLYINLLLHMIDQGWDYGSGLGTVHHLGYATRGFYSSVFLMRTVLKKQGILKKVQKIAEWFSGAGRMFRAEEEFVGESCDTLNTLLLPILISVLIDEDEKRKYISLMAVKNWLDKALEPAPGIKGFVKIDGTTFHHANHYPAYAMGAFKGITPVVYMLSKTNFAINSFSHNMLRKAVLAMRTYSNGISWPVSLSARHPVGDSDRGQISTFDPFYYMALAGVPEKKDALDEEMVGALLRLMQIKPFEKGERFINEGYSAEQAPNGHFNMNYACIALHRRKNWLACVRGHSKYIWGNETYNANNLYGRYVAYGNLQILSKGEPVTNKDSGYIQQGWDWNFWPGTTTVELPMEKLRADVCNVDEFSGYEEMLISDKAFVGGVSIDKTNGVFAFDLHSHAKYDATQVAQKSYFFFDEKIICIGTDISNQNPNGNTYTTLFQNYMLNTDDLIYADDKKISGVNYKETLVDYNMFYDNCGNGYYVPNGQKVLVSKSLQNSCDQNTGEPTSAYFAKAAIEHGAMPNGENYEYCIYVDVGLKQMQDNIKKIKLGEVYKTLCADNKLHCVYDNQSNTFAYVLWQKCKNLNFANLKAVSSPVLVMEKLTKNGFCATMSDPDLRLYEGVESDQIDEAGLQKEVSLYSRKWVKNKSMSKEVTLTFNGIWDITSPQQEIIVMHDTQNNETSITLNTSEGFTYEFIAFNKTI